jgi:hypothetical protein
MKKINHIFPLNMHIKNLKYPLEMVVNTKGIRFILGVTKEAPCGLWIEWYRGDSICKGKEGINIS